MKLGLTFELILVRGGHQAVQWSWAYHENDV